MSLLSTFISTQLIKALEHEFVNHTPEIQATIISEVKNFVDEAIIWLENKTQSQNPSSSTGASS